MKTNIVMSLFILIIACSCSNQPSEGNGNINDSLNQNPADSINNNSIDFELIECEIIADTLVLVSSSDLLYYPFGIYKKIKEFSVRFSFLELNTEYLYPYNDTSFSKTQVFNFSLNGSYIKLFFNKETARFEVICAKIFDRRIDITKKIQVGMHKTQFLNLFDANKLIDSAKDFDKICIKPGLLGIWYFYKFENDTLNSIFIDSDYQFDKN